MRAVDIIRRKRHGLELEREEIAFLVSEYTAGNLPDYQMSAFLMAVSLIGMSESETLVLTEEMLHSGTVLDLSDFPQPKVDKHSTGGVGDKTSLIVAPVVAAAGVMVPMISGPGIGHTGGTLDKLESIPGFDVRLDLSRFRHILEKAGCALIGPTAEIAPADRRIYALRDVTATVESIPLITASILSKKLAEGIDGLVLDVKVGSGAIMKDESSALELGNLLVNCSRRLGKRSLALVTDMDQPLGRRVGNALEVEEAIEVLNGGGPEDLRELCLLLAAHMLTLGKAVSEVEEGRQKASRLIASGAGLAKLVEIVKLQGGDPRAIEDRSRLVTASERKEVKASRAGYVHSIATESLGLAGMLLGAGRERVGDAIDPAVGLVIHVKTGDAVSRGDSLVTLHHNRASRLEEAHRLVAEAFEIADRPPVRKGLVRAILGREAGES